MSTQSISKIPANSELSAAEQLAKYRIFNIINSYCL